MTITVRDTIGGPLAPIPQDWTPAPCPDLTVEPWHGVPVPWRTPIVDAAVDVERSRVLARVDVPIEVSAPGRLWEGSVPGIPFHRVSVGDKNDAFNATSAEVLAANLTTMAEAFAADGASVALMVPPPPNPTFLSGWSVYADAIRDTAYSVQTGLIDLTDHWGSYGASSGFYHDDVHPNDAGSADIAAFVAAELLDRSA